MKFLVSGYGRDPINGERAPQYRTIRAEVGTTKDSVSVQPTGVRSGSGSLPSLRITATTAKTGDNADNEVVLHLFELTFEDCMDLMSKLLAMADHMRRRHPDFGNSERHQAFLKHHAICVAELVEEIGDFLEHTPGRTYTNPCSSMFKVLHKKFSDRLQILESISHEEDPKIREENLMCREILSLMNRIQTIWAGNPNFDLSGENVVKLEAR